MNSKQSYTRQLSFNPLPSSTTEQDIQQVIEKKTVTVHVTFHKIGEIDTKKECFDADVLVAAKWREPQLDKETAESKTVQPMDWSTVWNPKLFIENVIGEPKATASFSVEYKNDTEAYVVEKWRCIATFYENLELFDFPFDVQDLSINVMSEMHYSQVVLVDDPHNVHTIYKQFFTDKQEWHLYKYIESTQKCTSDKMDPLMIRPSLLVTCRAARRPAYFIWNIFSVTFLISCLAFVTFSDDNPLDLSFTLLLTTVAFKFIVNQSLPTISYLTYLDRYVLANMVLITSVSLWHGIHKVVYQTKNKCEDTEKNDTLIGADGLHHDTWTDSISRHKNLAAMLIYAGLFILYNIIFILNIIIVGSKKRRKMNRLEHEYLSKLAEYAEKQQKKHSRFSRLKHRTSESKAAENTHV